MENNIIANRDQEAMDIVNGITKAGEGIYTSFEAVTLDDKKLLYNASSNGQPIKDVKNRTLEMVDVVVIPSELEGKDGTRSMVPRTTIICKDGSMYTAASWGIYNSLKRVNAIFGTLHFPDGLKISPIDVATKNGSTINIVIV